MNLTAKEKGTVQLTGIHNKETISMLIQKCFRTIYDISIMYNFLRYSLSKKQKYRIS